MSAKTTPTIASTVSTVTSADGTTIAYESVGSGQPLVIVDGAMCYREFGPARSLATELSDRFTVYFYDRRGRGESTDTAPYDRHREIEDLAAIIAQASASAGGVTVDVMGQSSGGGLALLAAAAGVPMRRLAVYEAPYVGLRQSKGAPRDYHGDLDELVARGDRGGAVGYFMVKMVGAPAIMPVFMRLMPKVWKQLRAVAHTLPYDARVMGTFEVPTAELSAIAVPTLVMGGSKGAAEMKAAVRGVADAVAGSEHRILDGQTHQVSNDAIAPVLAEFFARQ